MNLSVIVATLEGCPFETINDAATIRRALHEAVAAGGFTLLHSHIHEFEPQGVTGTVVLSESHIAVHSWPEEGVLFLDLATCSGAEATEAAFARICQLIAHESICRQDVGYQGAAGRHPATMAAASPPALRRTPSSDRPILRRSQWHLP